MKYGAEPYVIAADISSNENFAGKAGWTWYTGSSGWFYNVGIRDILGMKKNGNILRVEPSIPDSWTTFKIIYKFKETIYEIEVHKDKKRKTMVDGHVQNSDVVELINDKRVHHIVAYR